MEFGVWFTSHPTAVISTYLTEDLMPVSMRDRSDFVTPQDWVALARDIDYCVVTVSNYQNEPGNEAAILDTVRKLKRRDVKVYLAFSCLLGPSDSDFDPMENADGHASRNWISPTDDRRAKAIVDTANTFVDELDPHGILLWYAHYPNEKYGYESERCVDTDAAELQTDKRAAVLTEFLETVTTGIRAGNPDTTLAIEVDIDGGTDVRYRNGVEPKRLGDVVDEILLHVHSADEDTVTRATQLAAETGKYGIDARYYVSIVNVDNFERLYETLTADHAAGITVYSPKRGTVREAVDFFLIRKWQPTVQRLLRRGSGIALVVGLYEFYAGLQWPVIGPLVPAPSLFLSAVLFVASFRIARLAFLSDRLATLFERHGSWFG